MCIQALLCSEPSASPVSTHCQGGSSVLVCMHSFSPALCPYVGTQSVMREPPLPPSLTAEREAGHQPEAPACLEFDSRGAFQPFFSSHTQLVGGETADESNLSGGQGGSIYFQNKKAKNKK